MGTSTMLMFTWWFCQPAKAMFFKQERRYKNRKTKRPPRKTNMKKIYLRGKERTLTASQKVSSVYILPFPRDYFPNNLGKKDPCEFGPQKSSRSVWKKICWKIRGIESFLIWSQKLTPPKFNIAPEKWWLEDYFPFGMVYFQGLY